jgi:hypothetical protein
VELPAAAQSFVQQSLTAHSGARRELGHKDPADAGAMNL